MNNRYIYNNFYELLKLINILIEHNIKPYNIKDETYNPTLFDNNVDLFKQFIALSFAFISKNPTNLALIDIVIYSIGYILPKIPQKPPFLALF